MIAVNQVQINLGCRSSRPHQGRLDEYRRRSSGRQVRSFTGPHALHHFSLRECAARLRMSNFSLAGYSKRPPEYDTTTATAHNWKVSTPFLRLRRGSGLGSSLGCGTRRKGDILCWSRRQTSQLQSQFSPGQRQTSVGMPSSIRAHSRSDTVTPPKQRSSTPPITRNLSRPASIHGQSVRPRRMTYVGSIL